MNCPPVEHGDVAEHGLAAIAEARRLDRADLKDAAQLVDDQRGQRLALDVLGDDEQRPAASCATFSSSGSMSRTLVSFFSWMRISASSNSQVISCVVMK